MQITKGKIMMPLRVVISGVEGIGKSTFASHFPDPLFIDTEGSTRQLDVARFDPPTTWEVLKTEVEAVINNPSLCQTLVIDTIDWAEKLCYDHVLQGKNIKGIEDLGYGAGYRYVYEEFCRLLDKLSMLPPKGVNVVLVAHTAMRKVELPDEMGSFDKWELKLQNGQKSSNAAKVKEWADMVLFANYKTMIIKEKADSQKGKGMGGKRVMYTTHRPTHDAKNRFGLPDECEFDYSVIAPFIPLRQAPVVQPQPTAPAPAPAPDPTPVPPQDDADPVFIQLIQQLNADGITDIEFCQACTSLVGFPPDMKIEQYPKDFIRQAITAGWNDIKAKVMELRDLPF